MAMPRKLKLMNVFLNGYSYQGVAKSVTLPKLTRKLEKLSRCGNERQRTGRPRP
ncbi:gpFII [Escherichia coli DEC4A]|nr:gpFII [Escherichia coli DEC4A]